MLTESDLLGRLQALGDDQAGAAKVVEDLAAGKNKQAEQNRQTGPFHARRGEDPLTSRGFSYLKYMGLLCGKIKKDYCKTELDVCSRLQKHYDERGWAKAEVNSFMAPFASEFIASEPGAESFAAELGQVVRAGVAGYTRETAAEEVRRDAPDFANARTRALSWSDATQGESLVAPPMMGELIELFRNNEVFIQAGARMMAMPPSGRFIAPRQTGAGSAYFIGESDTIPPSNPTTGDVVLQSKKLAALVKIPNELFRYSSISVEQFIREDLARVIALRLDKSLLEAVGSANEPKGLINYAGINTFTGADPGSVTNGYRIQPEDPYQMVAATESQNAVFRSFIMRPQLYATMLNRRADAVTAGDKQGPFVFNIVREHAANFNVTRLVPGNLVGYPVVKSTQISKARTKGTSSNLSYVLGGDFTEYMIAMSGALEFMVSTQGDTPFTTDQTWFRTIVFCDGAPRHEVSFTLFDNVYEAQ